MFGINVKGGTNAGCRITRPKPVAWECECGLELAGYWAKSPCCRIPRPI